MSRNGRLIKCEVIRCLKMTLYSAKKYEKNVKNKTKKENERGARKSVVV